MTLPSLRRLAAAGALALAALALAPAAQAQALHPLPPDFLATLADIDTSSDDIAASVATIKKADLTYSLFSRRRVEGAIARMEQQMPLLKSQTADLRREESLRMLLSMRSAFSDAQRSIGSISDTLHGVTVRTPVEAAALDKLLARLDGATARLDAALKRFDSGAIALAARASPAAAQALAPMPPASAQGQARAASAAAPAPASSSAGQAQAPASPSAAQAPAAPAFAGQSLRPLPPNLLATLKDIDTSSDEMAASVAAIRKADLTYSLFSQRRVADALSRMEKQLPMLKNQTADLRREESLGMLLSIRTAFSDAQRNVGSVSDILHGVTVRTPMEADKLDKLLLQLDGAAAHLDAALKKFDSGALAMIELLDKPRP